MSSRLFGWVLALVLAPAWGQEHHEDHEHHADQEAAGHDAMAGALGPQPMAREASGTAWQPDTSSMDGIHEMRGDWMVMLHG